MKAEIVAIRVLTNEQGAVELCLTVPSSVKLEASELKEQLAKGTKLQCEISKFVKKRSLDANAYFHLLVDKLAKKLNVASDEMKYKMVLEYGAIDIDDKGFKIGFKLLESIPLERVCKYGKIIDTVTENGRRFNKIIVYKRTSELNTGEMAKLIDGVVAECQEVGIETLTPEQIANMKSLWGKK